MREQSLLELQSLFHTINHWHSTVQSSANNHIICHLTILFRAQLPRWDDVRNNNILLLPHLLYNSTYLYVSTHSKILCCCSCMCAAGEWGHRVSWVATIELDRGRVNWMQDMCRRIKPVRLIGTHTQALNANLWQIGPYHHILPCYSCLDYIIYCTCDTIQSKTPLYRRSSVHRCHSQHTFRQWLFPGKWLQYFWGGVVILFSTQW